MKTAQQLDIELNQALENSKAKANEFSGITKEKLSNGILVLLYPTKDNQGGNLASKGWLVPTKTAKSFLASGYEPTINPSSTRALKELVVIAEEAQKQLAEKQKEVQLTASERAELEALRASKEEKVISKKSKEI